MSKKEVVFKLTFPKTMTLPTEECSFVLPDDFQLLVKKHNKLCSLEQLLEKIDSFLVLKEQKHDDLFEQVFVIHGKVLRLREQFVTKLYADHDKVWWKKSNQLMSNFIDESLVHWPRFRDTQRHHLCFYLGEDILDEAIHPQKKNKWPMTHFKIINYEIAEPKIVHEFKGEPNFNVPKTIERILFRELNNFVIELDRSLKLLIEDSFYKEECFDSFLFDCQELRIGLTRLRKECVEKFLGGEDAEILMSVFDERIRILWDKQSFEENREKQR